MAIPPVLCIEAQQVAFILEEGQLKQQVAISCMIFGQRFAYEH